MNRRQMERHTPGLSQVPMFKMYRHPDDPVHITFECSSCHGRFVINYNTMKESRKLLFGDTRPCPYCFKVNRIVKPKRSR